MKAIKTKFLGPTNSRGSRIVASDANKNRVTISWDHALNPGDNHRAAARALLNKMDYYDKDAVEIVSGELEDCMVHICLNDGFMAVAPKVKANV